MLQAVVESSTHTKEMYGLAGIFVTQLGIYAASRRRGNKRDAGASDRWEEVRDGLSSLTQDVRDLKHQVVGVDGTNGLRGDMKALALVVTTLREDVTDLQIAGARNAQGGSKS